MLNNDKKSIPPLIVALLASALYVATGCGGEVEKTDTPDISYFLDRIFTSETSNIVTVNGIPGSTVTLSGEGITFADTHTDIAVPASLAFSYGTFGHYALGIELTEADGSVYVNDSLTFEYFSKSVTEPIVAFSERATNDPYVSLLIAASRTKDTNEILVEGDVSTEQNGVWREIPQTSKVALTLTADDGRKDISVRLRNIYGNVSKKIDLSIDKKSEPLTNCTIEILDSNTKDGEIELYLAAADSYSEANELPFYFRALSKDLTKIMPFVEFHKEAYYKVQLTKTPGTKTVEIHLGDHAENYCERQLFKVEVNPDYLETPFSIDNGRPWTDSESITLNLNPKRFATRLPEVYIEGQLADTSKTKTWLPFAESMVVDLVPVRGPRPLKVKFRVPNSAYDPDNENSVAPEFIETDFFKKSIYLRPFVSISGSANPYTVNVPNMADHTATSITGCAETIAKVTDSAITCNASATSLSVELFFSDGSSVTRTISL